MDDSDNSELELMRRDYTHVLQEACQAFVDSATLAEGVLDSWNAGGTGQAALDRALVRMTLSEHRAARLILPGKDAMEYFGLPRSATARAFDPDPTVRVQDPGREAWDFRPWLSEKLTKLKTHLYDLLETIEYTLEHEALPPDGAHQSDAPERSPGVEPSPAVGTPASSEDEPLWKRLQEQALYDLRASRKYAEEILSAIEDMGLVVVDWRLSG